VSTEPLHDALRRLRQARGLSLADLGHLVSYSRKAIWDFEQGRRVPGPDVVQALDRALSADGYLVQLGALASADHGEISPLPDFEWQAADAETLAARLVGTAPNADNAVSLAHAWLVTTAPQTFQLTTGRRIGHDLVDQLAARVHQIRLVDDHVGGLDTAALVGAELAATARLLREASYDDRVGRRLLSVVAELCQIAGWTASDAGRHAEAQRLYLAGARAAHAADDPAGAASNLSSLAYQIANVGDPREAELLARTAVRGADGAVTPGARSLLLERLAWAQARAGEANAAARTLDQVDDTFVDSRPDEEPIWCYWLNPEEIEVMRGRVWTQLELPLRAVPALDHAIRAYASDSPRERALYLTWLAEALLQGHEVDQAAAAAARAAQLAAGAGSDRAAQRVSRLRRLLDPYAGQSAVDRFLKVS
jgi:transcriptional regulator with XRE-family HTH domain